MPEISRFYGIVIRMYLINSEHPPPNIHIKYSENEAVMELNEFTIVEGKIPNKCYHLVKEWAILHQNELKEMWNTQNFHKIQPLE